MDRDRCNVVHEIDRSVYYADVECAKLVSRRSRRIECFFWNTSFRECIFVFVPCVVFVVHPRQSNGPFPICQQLLQLPAAAAAAVLLLQQQQPVGKNHPVFLCVCACAMDGCASFRASKAFKVFSGRLGAAAAACGGVQGVCALPELALKPVAAAMVRLAPAAASLVEQARCCHVAGSLTAARWRGVCCRSCALWRLAGALWTTAWRVRRFA